MDFGRGFLISDPFSLESLTRNSLSKRMDTVKPVLKGHVRGMLYCPLIRWGLTVFKRWSF